ncbi:MAG: 4Fe-4S dicluster domain-containing protein [Ardenticatenaceae bacterium]|nr:4Fe-4S dicluster domain-containing protein [Ardenticatenaceae bacterium]
MDQKGLRELEAQCIQEEAPPCQATCPLHVDMRGMLTAVAQGDFASARTLYLKSIPFPGIVSRVCDEPCRGVCTRGRVGETLTIRALEQACLLGEGPRPAVKKLPGKPKRVAVVGGGLSGLTAVSDLARKGYSLTLYEATDRLGGRIWDTPESVLPRDLITRDLAVLAELGVDVRLETAPDLDALCQSYDAVYLAIGQGSVVVDPLTYAADRPGLFAGGSLLRDRWSPITSMSDGRRAATSIDRYLQNVSLSAARSNEGAYETKLYTNIAGIDPTTAVPLPAAGYSEAEAIAEAQRCLQCQCLECVKVCEYLQEYGSYPRKYARTVYNNLSIVMGERHANTFINSCATCGLCAAVCPTNFDMGAVCKTARGVMVEQKRMPPSAHEFALRDMAFSNSDKFALTRHQPGTTTSEYVFFPGCQLAGSAPGQVTAVYDYLQAHLSGGVGLMLGCCGAPADWAGRNDLHTETLSQFQANYDELGRPKVVLACSSCFQTFKARLPEVELVSLYTVLEEKGLPETAVPLPADAIAIHDPCTTRYETAVQDSVRHLVGRLGYDVEELPRSRETTTCCGFGGLMVYANRDLAKKVVAQRIAESPADYVTYCAVCRDYFAAQGKPTRHLLDLIFGSSTDGGRGPGFSQKHENRARLKRQLLQERWGETVTGQEDYASIQLNLNDEVLALMEDRLILVEDVQQVIAYAERTGQKLLSPATGHFLAQLRPNTVTYWVEYMPEGDGYTVFNAYSHRMDVGEGKRP